MGFPAGYKVFSPFPFGSMDQQSARTALEENEFYNLENYIRVGNGNLRTVWDKGAALYTVPNGKTIVYFYFYNLGATNYVIVFLSDGTAVQVDSVTQAQTVVSANANTFYTGGQLPACCQWGSLYLLISNNITSNSYWVWDGTLLYQAGSLGPGVTLTSGGAGYSSTPSITAFGGSGHGATAVATISNGSVVNVKITNAGTGYLPGDIVQFAFSGGGSDSSAILTAVLAVGVVASLQLVSPGSGFTTGTYAITFSGGGGGGAAGTYTVAGGKIVSLSLTSGGSGYTGSPSISFPLGGGVGAVGVASLTPGTVASVTVTNGGTGFTSTPTITFEGGGGTGATGTAVLTSGAISSVTMVTNGSGYTSAPTIVVSSGYNNAAAATGTLMPYGVSGAAIETYMQRVWLPYPNQTGNEENGGTFLVSAPGSLTDFATSDGGVTYTSTDSFLRYQYTNIKQLNGYLYPFGDSSIDVISNVQTSGSTSTTTFNYQNTDPQVGTSWRDTVIDFSRTLLVANPLGVYGLYGGSVTKISGKMDNLFTRAVLPDAGGVTPSGAVANIYSQKIALMLLTIRDLYTDAPRTVMLAWNEKEWFVVSQSVSLIFIGSQEVNSDITAWGTDGTSLYPLFATPSSSLPKIFSTKLYGAQTGMVLKQARGLYVQATDLTATGTGIVFSTTVDCEIGSFTPPNVVSFPAQTPSSPRQSPVFPMESGDVVGVNLGVTMTSTSPDFSLNHLILGYTDLEGLFGSSNLNGFQGE